MKLWINFVFWGNKYVWDLLVYYQLDSRTCINEKKVIHYHKLELLHFKETIQSFDTGRCYAMVIMAESKVMRVKCVTFRYPFLQKILQNDEILDLRWVACQALAKADL